MDPLTHLPPAAAVHFDLEVQPEHAGSPWRAVLKPRDGSAARMFDTPLALARFVAQFLDPKEHGGLR
jgi:hypothetical protein